MRHLAIAALALALLTGCTRTCTHMGCFYVPAWWADEDKKRN